MTADGDVDARIVVDARGRRRDGGAAAQTAYGVVVAERPADGPVLMDLRPAGAGRPPTFGYIGARRRRLARRGDRPRRPPARAARRRSSARLAARIGTPPAGRTERCRSRSAAACPSRRGPVPLFGAAAGYAHPATGFSVAASLRAAPRCRAAGAGDRPDAGRRCGTPSGRGRCGAPAGSTTTGCEVLLAPRPGRAGDVLRRVLRAAGRRLGAVPAHRRAAAARSAGR